MKKCPFCAEQIADDVAVCPLCHSELQPAARLQAPPETSDKAIVSLVVGIASLLFSVPAAVVAIVFGHLAKAEIRRSHGRLTGNGMAIAGLILGYIGATLLPMVIVAAIAIPNLLRTRMAANEAGAVGALRTLNTACVTYLVTYGGYPITLSKLGPGDPASGKLPPNPIDVILGKQRADLIDSVLASGEKSGYRFIYSPGPADARGYVRAYAVHASPVTPGTTGQRNFFTDQTGVIRSNMDGPADGNSTPLG